jgi:hypothetical protein
MHTFNPLAVRLLIVRFALIKHFMSLMSVLGEVENLNQYTVVIK